jgi:hypothetical protein
VDYSWIDLVFEADRPHVILQWNTLMSGKATTFEMRWSNDKKDENTGKTTSSFQWVVASCVPLLDDAGRIITVAGNLVNINVIYIQIVPTSSHALIDIQAQKVSQGEALQRAEALERAHASEQLFARFAELAPAAIYIFDAQKGVGNLEPFCCVCFLLTLFLDAILQQQLF